VKSQRIRSKNNYLLWLEKGEIQIGCLVTILALEQAALDPLTLISASQSGLENTTKRPVVVHWPLRLRDKSFLLPLGPSNGTGSE
jgi:hypothetical protein